MFETVRIVAIPATMIASTKMPPMMDEIPLRRRYDNAFLRSILDRKLSSPPDAFKSRAHARHKNKVIHSAVCPREGNVERNRNLGRHKHSIGISCHKGCKWSL